MNKIISEINQRIKEAKKSLDNTDIATERHYFQGRIRALQDMKSIVRQSDNEEAQQAK